jgi:hypothetical protein
MRGAIPSRPQYVFIAWCSVKAQGQLYLYLSFTFIIGKEGQIDNWGLDNIVYIQTVKGRDEVGNLLHQCLYISRRGQFALHHNSEFSAGKE